MGDRDVVVIGAGTAGLCAAVAAALAGAGRVLVLEKGGRAEAGGNSYYSHAGFRAPYDAATIEPFLVGMDPGRRRRLVLPGYSVQAFAKELDAATEGRMNPAIRDRFAERAAPTMEWMRRLGIPWSLNRTLQRPDGEHFEPGMILAAGGDGGGRALAESWLAIGARHGVEVAFDAPAVGITLDPARGHSVSIGGTGPMAGTSVRAPSVIAAAGGFQASPERRVRLMGAAYASVAVRGTANDTGEILEMLLAEGAGRDGTWRDAVVSPIDADGPAVSGGQDLNRYSWPWGSRSTGPAGGSSTRARTTPIRSTALSAGPSWNGRTTWPSRSSTRPACATSRPTPTSTQWRTGRTRFAGSPWPRASIPTGWRVQ